MTDRYLFLYKYHLKRRIMRIKIKIPATFYSCQVGAPGHVDTVYELEGPMKKRPYMSVC